MGEVRLLIVDGDSAVRGTIKEHASSEGYSSDEAADGIAALKLFRRNEYNLIVLDAVLPELDGHNVLRQIRKVSDVPVILVSEHGELKDRLSGFETGADDFLQKPFYPLELMARIRVFLRRSGGVQLSPPRRFSFNGLFIDTASRSVYIDERAVQLTPKEYDLLYFLSKNPNRAFSREDLLNEVWGFDFFGTDRTVDTHIKTLRESLRPYQQYIVTVWGFGYKFVV